MAYNEDQPRDERGRWGSNGGATAKELRIGRNSVTVDGLEFTKEDVFGSTRGYDRFRAGKGQPVNDKNIIGWAPQAAPQAVRMKDGTVYLGDGHYQILVERVFGEDGLKQTDVQSYGHYQKSSKEFFPLNVREAGHVRTMIRTAWDTAQSYRTQFKRWS